MPRRISGEMLQLIVRLYGEGRRQIDIAWIPSVGI